MTVWQRAFVRGGLVASVIGALVLSAPVLVALLRPGPIDSRIYTNLVLIPVFLIVIFAFGGFIGLLRALSRDQQAQRRAARAGHPSPVGSNPGGASR